MANPEGAVNYRVEMKATVLGEQGQLFVKKVSWKKE